jgi:hypothetical protein
MGALGQDCYLFLPTHALHIRSPWSRAPALPFGVFETGESYASSHIINEVVFNAICHRTLQLSVIGLYFEHPFSKSQVLMIPPPSPRFHLSHWIWIKEGHHLRVRQTTPAAIRRSSGCSLPRTSHRSSSAICRRTSQRRMSSPTR